MDLILATMEVGLNSRGGHIRNAYQRSAVAKTTSVSFQEKDQRLQVKRGVVQTCIHEHFGYRTGRLDN